MADIDADQQDKHDMIHYCQTAVKDKEENFAKITARVKRQEDIAERVAIENKPQDEIIMRGKLLVNKLYS